MKFFKFLKRQYPYAPIAFIGRKNVEKILGADIKKLRKLDKMTTSETTLDKADETEAKSM
ncbi:MAG: hypothetical protein ACJAW1_003683, partial [Glaciecola sp.]